MSNDFYNLGIEDKVGLIKKAREKFGLSHLAIEKDFWVCWLLEKIFTLPLHIAFKGGTSLSKVFGLIKRFSEDCDITIDYRNFKPELSLENISKTQLKKISDELKEKLKVYVSETILPYLQDEISKSFSDKAFDITLSEDGEQLRFYYPSAMNTLSGYLRDHVFIEFGVRNSTEPCEKYLITPYLSQATETNLNFPNPRVDTLSPIRTFWEKATLIHVEYHRDRLDNTPERLSRHWYDLYMLHHSWVGKEALSRNGNDILKSVIEHKKAFFNAGYANYDDCLLGELRLVPTSHHLNNLEQDFEKMIKADMFYETPASFNHIIKNLKDLESTINTFVKNNLESEKNNQNIKKYVMKDLHKDDYSLSTKMHPPEIKNFSKKARKSKQRH
jgi:hypothetical protein